MSKFRRVSEKENIPDYMEKAIDGNFQGDPYAHLKKSASERRQIIAKKASDYKMSPVDEPKDWEKVLKQENYQDFQFPRNEQELRANTLGSSQKIVRKAEYIYDEPLTARDLESQLKPFTPEQYMNVMLRGASIWNPDMEEVKDAFQRSQDDALIVSNGETAEMMRKSRHEDWEGEIMGEIQQSRYSASRANPILRTASETPSNNKYESINWEQLDARERQKVQMRENRRQSSMAIKRHNSGREAVHQAWEDDLDLDAPALTLQQYYSKHGIDLEVE